MKVLFTIILSFALACNLYSCDALAQVNGTDNGPEGIVRSDDLTIAVPDPNGEYFISTQAEEDAMIAICAATLLMKGQIEAGAWFTTIVEDVTAINFFTNLFTLGLDTGQITPEEIDLAATGCIKVMNDYLARKAAEKKS